MSIHTDILQVEDELTHDITRRAATQFVTPLDRCADAANIIEMIVVKHS